MAEASLSKPKAGEPNGRRNTEDGVKRVPVRGFRRRGVKTLDFIYKFGSALCRAGLLGPSVPTVWPCEQTVSYHGITGETVRCLSGARRCKSSGPVPAEERAEADSWHLSALLPRKTVNQSQRPPPAPKPRSHAFFSPCHASQTQQDAAVSSGAITHQHASHRRLLGPDRKASRSKGRSDHVFGGAPIGCPSPNIRSPHPHHMATSNVLHAP